MLILSGFSYALFIIIIVILMSHAAADVVDQMFGVRCCWNATVISASGIL